MRLMLIVQVLVRAAVTAVALLGVWAFNPIAALGAGAAALLVAAKAGIKHDPPLFRWPAAVSLSAIFSGLLLWVIYDTSPLVVRIHNAGKRPVGLALDVTNRVLPAQHLGPGVTTWRIARMGEGAILLDCDDGLGRQTIMISGYVTTGDALFENVDLRTCQSASVAERRFGF